MLFVRPCGNALLHVLRHRLLVSGGIERRRANALATVLRVCLCPSHEMGVRAWSSSVSIHMSCM